ncbi:DUF397 domain-containing protein [Streptomyces sp. CA-250714]|uniref:DUF397 domain-containing protein n=1 Tax=Streptomyces sp. CA-250714 TaxID=3240060 RepID=UPI003D91C7FC
MRRLSPDPYPAWRTSSFSGAHGDCLEIATNLPHTVPVRDTKQRAQQPDQPSLCFPREAWAQFLGYIRTAYSNV